MTRLFSPHAFDVIPPSTAELLDHGLTGLIRPMHAPLEHGSSVGWDQKLANLSSNLGAFKDSFVQKWHGTPWVQDAIAIPQKLAYNAAEWIAGGDIEPRTPYQAQLKNLPGPIDLAVSATKSFVADTWNAVSGALSLADSAAFTTISRLGNIEPHTEQQWRHLQNLEEVKATLTGVLDGAGRVARFNPFVEDPWTSSLLGSMAAAAITRPSVPLDVANGLGPLRPVGDKMVGAQVINKRGGGLEVLLDKNRVATYDPLGHELYLPNLYWPAAPVNTVGAILNGRGLEVQRVRGNVTLGQRYSRGENLSGTLNTDSSVGVEILRLLDDAGDPKVWNVGLLQGFQFVLEGTPTARLVDSFYIEGLRGVGRGRKKFNSIEVRMRRLPKGESSEIKYKGIYSGEREISDTTREVLDALTRKMFEKTSM